MTSLSWRSKTPAANYSSNKRRNRHRAKASKKPPVGGGAEGRGAEARGQRASQRFPLPRETLFFQPVDAIARPGMAFAPAVLPAAQAQAVRALLIYVQIEGHPRFAQGLGELQAVFDGDRFVLFGVPNEAGW